LNEERKGEGGDTFLRLGSKYPTKKVSLPCWSSAPALSCILSIAIPCLGTIAGGGGVSGSGSAVIGNIATSVRGVGSSSGSGGGVGSSSGGGFVSSSGGGVVSSSGGGVVSSSSGGAIVPGTCTSTSTTCGCSELQRVI
jgi:hypothetical protein